MTKSKDDDERMEDCSIKSTINRKEREIGSS